MDNAKDVMDWARIQRELAAPFDPETVEGRPATGKGGANAKVRLVAYISASSVMERLDAVCGAGGWSFQLEPVVVEGGELRVARGRLTLFGLAKDGLGTATNWEPSKGCASDALKRAGVMFGIGRYLASIPQVSCQLDGDGQIPSAMRAKLVESLRRRMAA